MLITTAEFVIEHGDLKPGLRDQLKERTAKFRIALDNRGDDG